MKTNRSLSLLSMP